MRHFLFLTLFVAFSGILTAQETWQNYSRTAELEINFRYVECHDEKNGTHKSVVVLQFVNLSGKQISVSYNKNLWYNGECRGCDNAPEQQFAFRMAPGETLTGSCEDRQAKPLVIFHKMLDVKAATLEKFELANIKITTVQ